MTVELAHIIAGLVVLFYLGLFIHPKTRKTAVLGSLKGIAVSIGALLGIGIVWSLVVLMQYYGVSS